MGIESESMGLLAGKVDGSWIHRGLLGSVTGLKLCSVSLSAREEIVVTSENSFKHTSILCARRIAQKCLGLASWGNSYLLRK